MSTLEQGEVKLRAVGGEKKKEEEEERDHLPLWENIYFGAIWAIVTAVMIWFIVGISQQYQQAKSAPATIITFQSPDNQDLFMVTICNWNQIIAPYDPCDFCDLELIGCLDIAGGSDCTLQHLQIDSGNVSDGVFNCYQFNTNPAPESVIKSAKPGYAGSFSALFLVANPPEDDTLRVGLQVSLTPVGEQPDVFGEDKFAPPGLDSYFAAQTVQTVHQELDPVTSETRYDASFSTTGLTRTNNATHSYISISWAFQTLSVQTITYEPQYTLNNFFGDFAGMVGTLMGLDVVKLAAGFIVAFKAIRMRNIYPLQEHFNG